MCTDCFHIFLCWLYNWEMIFFSKSQSCHWCESGLYTCWLIHYPSSSLFFCFINVNIFTGVNELLTWETCVCYALLLLLSQRRISTLKHWIVRYHCYRRLYEQTMKVHLFDFITIQTAQLPMWWSLVRCKGCAVLFFVPIKCLPPVFQVG